MRREESELPQQTETSALLFTLCSAATPTPSPSGSAASCISSSSSATPADTLQHLLCVTVKAKSLLISSWLNNFLGGSVEGTLFDTSVIQLDCRSLEWGRQERDESNEIKIKWMNSSVHMKCSGVRWAPELLESTLLTGCSGDQPSMMSQRAMTSLTV